MQRFRSGHGLDWEPRCGTRLTPKSRLAHGTNGNPLSSRDRLERILRVEVCVRVVVQRAFREMRPERTQVVPDAFSVGRRKKVALAVEKAPYLRIRAELGADGFVMPDAHGTLARHRPDDVQR